MRMPRKKRIQFDRLTNFSPKGLSKLVPITMQKDPMIARLIERLATERITRFIEKDIKARVAELRKTVQILAYEHIGSWAIANGHHHDGDFSDRELFEIGKTNLAMYCEANGVNTEDGTLLIVDLNSGDCFLPAQQKNYGFFNKRRWKTLKSQIFEQHSRMCVKCGSQEDTDVKHIRPRNLWPHLESTPSNCEVICRKCFTGKHDRQGKHYQKKKRRKKDRYAETTRGTRSLTSRSNVTEAGKAPSKDVMTFLCPAEKRKIRQERHERRQELLNQGHSLREVLREENKTDYTIDAILKDWLKIGKITQEVYDRNMLREQKVVEDGVDLSAESGTCVNGNEISRRQQKHR